MPRNSDTFPCPHCYADVPVNALACPKCGSSDETGWSEAAKYAHLLPEREENTLTPRSQTWKGHVLSGGAALLLLGYLLMQGFLWGVVILAVVVVIIVGTRVLRPPAFLANRGREKQLYNDLLTKTRGDREMAERLIEAERRRDPGATRLRWIDDALFRYDRDRR